jgi:hypothetical protein
MPLLQELQQRILDGEALGEGGKVRKRLKIGGHHVSNAMRRQAKRALLQGKCGRVGETRRGGGVRGGGGEVCIQKTPREEVEGRGAGGGCGRERKCAVMGRGI